MNKSDTVTTFFWSLQDFWEIFKATDVLESLKRSQKPPKLETHRFKLQIADGTS